MEQDKAFLKFGKLTVIEAQKEILSQLFPEIIIVSNMIESFKSMDARVVKDLIPNSGPLGGLYTGLKVSSYPHSFLIACDMPFINLRLVEYMVLQLEDNDVVIPVSNRGLEALFAIYSLRCIEIIKKHLDDRNLKLVNILDFHKVRYLSQEEIKKFDPDEFSFINMNNPEDYQYVERILKKTSQRGETFWGFLFLKEVI